MIRKVAILGLFATGALALAVPDAQAVYINGKWYSKGVKEEGKVWYDTPIPTTIPSVETRVFGINCPDAGVPPSYPSEGGPNCTGLTGDNTVFGALTCIQKDCLRKPDKPSCAVPGNAQGTPYEVQGDSFIVDSSETLCATKGAKGNCKVTQFSTTLLVNLEGQAACPGGFVPDFIPDPFVGRTSTCDSSEGVLFFEGNKPKCLNGDTSTDATAVLCQFVAKRGATVGDLYAIQVEIPDKGVGYMTEQQYIDLGCKFGSFKAQ